jgi:hypothetical protein
LVVEESFLASKTACLHGTVRTVRVLRGAVCALSAIFVETKLAGTCFIISREFPILIGAASYASFKVSAVAASRDGFGTGEALRFVLI